MAGEILGPRVGIDPEAAVNDPDLRIAEASSDAFRRPEEIRAREGAHRDNLAVLRVMLYERAGCHLCEETHGALLRLARGRSLAIERVDIATDAATERRYLVRIPVLAIGKRELDAAGLTDGQIAAWLDT